MATKWTSPVWRMPENSNHSKFQNYSLYFDGSELINYYQDDLFEFTNTPFSVSIWVKGRNNQNRGIICCSSRSNTYGWQIQEDSGGTVSFTAAQGTNARSAISTTLISDTEWLHIVGVFKPSASANEHVEIWINGVREGVSGWSSSPTLSYQATPYKRISFGYGANTGRRYIGYISEAAIFDYDLSENQVKYLYNDNDTVNPTLANPQNPMAIAGPTPVAYYPLGRSSTGSSSTLTIPNESGSGDTVFDFNGSSDYITYNRNPSISTSNVTISGWFNTNTTSGLQGIVGGGGNDGMPIWLVNGKLAYYQWTSGGWGTNMIYNSVLNTNQWYHFAATWDESTTTRVLYLNGEPVLTNTTTTDLVWTNNYGYLGRYSSSEFNGQLSNIQIHNSTIPATGANSIKTLYNNGTPLKTAIDTSNLYGWWKLDVDTSTWNGSDWVISDTSVDWKKSLNLFNKNHVNIRSMSSMANVLDDVTYSCWIRTSADGQYGKYQIPFGGRSNAGEGFSPNRLWTPYNTTDLTFPVAGATKLNDGLWHHIATTFNDSTGVVKYYVDGQLDVSITWPSYITHFGIEIGYGGTSNDYTSLKGQVSNCVLYSSELTQPQIETLYNNGVPQLSPSFSPYGWWKCNNIATGIQDSIGSNNGTNDGAIESDIAVSPNNGISSGMTTANLVTSDLNRSLLYSSYSMYFDGAVDTVNVLDSSTLKPSTITISIWFKSEGTQGAYTYLINKYYSGSGPAYSLYTGPGNTNLSFSIRKGNDTGWSVTTLADSGNVMDGLWHNVIATFDGTTQKLYIDGILKTTATPGTTGITYGSGDLTIGAFLNTGTLDFNGYLSNAAIWNRAITENEILTIYNGGAPNDISSLSPVGWWSLSGDSYYNGSNWICPDLSTNSNNGTGSNLAVTALVGDAPGSTGNGTGTSMNIPGNLEGNAPNSDKNAYSVNMVATNRDTSVPDISS